MRHGATIGRVCTPKIVVSGSQLREVELKKKNASTQDIINGILMADKMGDDFIMDGVDCLVGRDYYETMSNVWEFVKKNVRYVADTPGHEVIKSPGALFKMGYGDCKSMTLAVNSILKKLGVPRTYRFAAYDNQDFTHVYAVAHTPDGPVKLDTVHDAFDDEVKYVRKKDYALNGAPKCNTSPNLKKAVAAGFGIWLLIIILK